MKRITAIMLTVIILLLAGSSLADRIPEKKTADYIGAMRVVYCKNYVTLRETPSKKAISLAHVPLGEIVYSCKKIKSTRFYECEYQGQVGYILKEYLQKAPEFEPPVSSAVSQKMTLEEVTESGSKILEWDDYNISVVATHDLIDIDNEQNEILKLGCFIDGEPLWGHIETVEVIGQYSLLKAFIGGTPDDPMVMLYDGGYGLTMIDLLSGKDKWTVSVANCPMGNAAAVAVDDNGVIYIAGTDGPDPVAITLDGHVLWQSDIEDPDIYDPYEMEIKNNLILVKYKSGKENGYKLVTLDNTGEVVETKDIRE